MTLQPERTPAAVAAEQGEVLIDGPNGLALSLTPEAAHHTARALRVAACKAKRQRSTGDSSQTSDAVGTHPNS